MTAVKLLPPFPLLKVGDCMTFDMSFAEILTVARLIYKRMDELQSLILRYERFSEDNDAWIEKIAVNQGQYQLMKDVYERLCYMIAAYKIQEKFESEEMQNEVRKNNGSHRRRTSGGF